MRFGYVHDGDYCAVCAASNAGDVDALCVLAEGGPLMVAARVELYDGFGVNDEDRVALRTVRARELRGDVRS